ncbi:hypothetical protein BDFG_06610 [Blastomyces dermatitidis ATCC 26199]|nr:hypothetical protein BDFG_06610 [Blastomyces dermatitidis ATCC 26199]
MDIGMTADLLHGAEVAVEAGAEVAAIVDIEIEATREAQAALLPERIVVEKLTKNVNENHLREIFGVYGEIQSLELPMNPHFMTNRGTAYILYHEVADAEAAISHMHEAQLDGAVLNVSIVLPRRTFSRSPPPARNRDRHRQEVDIALRRPVVVPHDAFLALAAWKDTIYIVLGHFRDLAPHAAAHLPIPRDLVPERHHPAEGLIGIALVVVGDGTLVTAATATVVGAGVEA